MVFESESIGFRVQRIREIRNLTLVKELKDRKDSKDFSLFSAQESGVSGLLVSYEAKWAGSVETLLRLKPLLRCAMF